MNQDAAAGEPGQSVLLASTTRATGTGSSVDLMVQITPTETLTITPSASYRFDDLSGPSPSRRQRRRPDRGLLGLQEQVGWSAGMDVEWAPVERIKLTFGYIYESYYRKMESRSRPVVDGVAVDYSNYDWISNITDTINTIYGGVKVAVIPGVMDWGLSGSWAYALGTTHNRNPTAPVSGSASNNLTAQAKRFPAFDDQLIRLETAVAYYFPYPMLRGWTAKLGYVFESWQKHDFRTDTLNPFIPGVSSIFLGNDLRNYTANTIIGTLGYRFR